MSMVRRSVEAGGRRRKSRDALTPRPEIERLLDAARAPASPRELAGEREAVDLFARARLVSASVPAREAPVATRSARTGLKAVVAAAGAVGLLSSGVAFASTGHVPFSGAIKSVTSHVTGQDDDASASDSGKGPTGENTNQGPDGDQASPNGPNVMSLQGLCRAYAEGQKATHGHALEQRPFTALVAAAGGEDQISDFCAALPTTPHQGGQGPSHPAQPTQPTHPTTGPSGDPSDHATQPSKPAHPTQATSPTRPAQSTQRPRPDHPTEQPRSVRPASEAN
jgi:hypothetical protein